MRRPIFTTLAASALTLAAFVIFQPTLANTVINKLTVNGLTLRGKNAAIVQQGARPVRVKDKLRVDKSLNVRGNITLADGRTVDGVDVSALATQVDAIEIPEEVVELPVGCIDGQIPKYDGESWECDEDIDTDTDTTYTAGTGIQILNNTISTSVTDTDTTYTAGDGLALSGTEFSMEGTSYQNVIIVAKSGGDYATIGDAVDSISGNTSTNQFVIWVAPGVYEERVDLPDYVHLVGASRDAVKVKYLSTTLLNGVVNLGVGSLLENLSVESDGSFYSFAVYNLSAGEATVRNVKITVNSAIFGSGIQADYQSPMNIYDSEITAESISAAYGVNTGGDMVLENTTITVAATTGGFPVYHAGGVGGGEAVVRDSTLAVTSDGSAGNCVAMYLASTDFDYEIYGTKATVASCLVTSYGAAVEGSSTQIQYSDFTGVTDAVYVGDGVEALVASSRMVGGSSTSGSGTITCAYSYDENYAALDDSCN